MRQVLKRRARAKTLENVLSPVYSLLHGFVPVYAQWGLTIASLDYKFVRKAAITRSDDTLEEGVLSAMPRRPKRSPQLERSVPLYILQA